MIQPIGPNKKPHQNPALAFPFDEPIKAPMPPPTAAANKIAPIVPPQDLLVRSVLQFVSPWLQTVVAK